MDFALTSDDMGGSRDDSSLPAGTSSLPAGTLQRGSMPRFRPADTDKGDKGAFVMGGSRDDSSLPAGTSSLPAGTLQRGSMPRRSADTDKGDFVMGGRRDDSSLPAGTLQRGSMPRRPADTDKGDFVIGGRTIDPTKTAYPFILNMKIKGQFIEIAEISHDNLPYNSFRKKNHAEECAILLEKESLQRLLSKIVHKVKKEGIVLRDFTY